MTLQTGMPRVGIRTSIGLAPVLITSMERRNNVTYVAVPKVVALRGCPH